MVDFKQWILETFYPEIITEIAESKSNNNILKSKLHELHTYNAELKLTKQELKDLIEKETKDVLSPIDRFLSENYREVVKFAYRNKRRYAGIKYAVYPNEMITPNSYKVILAKREVGNVDNLNMRDLALKVGRYVDRRTKWVSDEDTTGMEDFYHYAQETLISREADCESHTFVVASMFPELFGVAFGNTQRDKKGTWHAFNVFVHNNELWVLETNSVLNFPNGGNTWVRKYKDSKYYINEIFTLNKTFELDGSNKFGIVAR